MRNFTAINNNILDTLCKHSIAPNSRKIFDTILRLTFGYNRMEAEISLEYFAIKTGLDKKTISKNIKNLLSQNYIFRTKTGRTATYTINNPSVWGTHTLRTDSNTTMTEPPKPTPKKCQKRNFSPTCNIYIKTKDKIKTTKKKPDKPPARCSSLELKIKRMAEKYVDIRIEKGTIIRNRQAYINTIRQLCISDREQFQNIKGIIIEDRRNKRKITAKKRRNAAIKGMFYTLRPEIENNRTENEIVIKLKNSEDYIHWYTTAEQQLKSELDQRFIKRIPEPIIIQRILKLKEQKNRGI